MTIIFFFLCFPSNSLSEQNKNGDGGKHTDVHPFTERIDLDYKDVIPCKGTLDRSEVEKKEIAGLPTTTAQLEWRIEKLSTISTTSVKPK